MAEAFGVRSWRVTEPQSNLRRVLKKRSRHGEPTLVDIVCQPLHEAKSAGLGVGGVNEDRCRGHHDMGGLPAGQVEPIEHDYDEWERRVDAYGAAASGSTGKKRLMTVDELRKNIEALPPETYDRTAYYEKWITLAHADTDPARRDHDR